MARGRMLRIGVSARFFYPQPGATDVRSKTVAYLEQSMANWVMSGPCMAVLIPSLDGGAGAQAGALLADYARELDGLVLQGGTDLSPLSYGEAPLRPEWAGDAPRDAYEIELFNRFVEAGKPVLGICRGQQLVNVALGGSLWQDIATQIPGAGMHRKHDTYEHHFHAVSFVPGSRLAALYPAVERGRVNSIHHQAVRKLGDRLEIEAWSEPDRVPEAIRWRGPSYVAAVQWHPEFLAPDDASVVPGAPLLAEFLAAVRERA